MMKAESTHVEAIVRIVLERLRSLERAQQPPSKSSSGDVLSGDSATSKVEQELRLDQPLITLEQLRGCPEGLQVLSVTPRAVVTPAVVDELRDRGIRLKRSLSPTVCQPLGEGLLVMAESERCKELSLPAEVIASSHNCTADVGRVAAHLNSGGRFAIWWSDRPFAAMCAAAHSSCVRAAQLSHVDDLPRATREAEANLCVLDAQHWNASDVRELVRLYTAD